MSNTDNLVAKFERERIKRTIYMRLHRKNVSVPTNKIYEMIDAFETVGNVEIDMICCTLLENFGVQQPNKISSLKDRQEFERKAMLEYSRSVYENIANKKLQKYQWDRIVAISHDLNFIQNNGEISEKNLKVIAKVISVLKSRATSQTIKEYIELIKKLEGYDKIILGANLWFDSIELYKKYKGKEPSNATVYSWFNRQGMSYKGSKRYSPEEAVEVYLRAMF